MPPPPPPNTFELQPRSRAASRPPLPPEHFDALDSDSDDAAAGLLGNGKPPKPRRRWWTRLWPRRTRTRTSWRRRLSQLALVAAALLAAWIVLTLLFAPTYTPSHAPASWARITDAVQRGGGANPRALWTHLPGEGDVTKHTRAGRGNPDGEKIFIAANIVNADLINNEWGPRVMELLDLLGPENVFISVFENDSGPETRAALHTLDARIAAHMPAAGRSIVSTQLPFSGVARTQVRPGESYVKRIAYLAEVRNRALLPLLGDIPSLSAWHQPAYPPYARILFLNDVVFEPTELVHLLFSTHGGRYAAACGADFINPFKFYDTFATRDAAGFHIGVPFFPFFATPAARAAVRRASDAVEVASCWGGAVAFNASYFTGEAAVRFRSEPEPWWDASECCLVHADIDGKKYVNAFVRSAYDAQTFSWLPAVRRIEQLFVPVHRLLGVVLGMPWGGARRRRVGRGGFCGGRKLLVMNEHRGEGERGWRGVEVPVGGPESI
ncbi:cryptococcal mannosyltransferase 1-domain-containing protein [Geopyxis carbonaria]|nr:cryptococcal mannosyltransferase 1-domain-containing protein [Geopyxis carbonaria]